MLVFIVFNILFSNFVFIQCPFPPIGDEVQAGSVLLPATRRGRYLANIVRRQAVDGTGIKFNKDADRMNAEAKKKVDVLSEELLPYIIAEQERRTTLYKRVMTAIQNGEKGVTIAEIRNKPPLIIRKGLMYRCPANRAPKEPDGSGVILCEDDQDASPIMYDSCLSAEDKELYVAENKYFFCNRHKTEGPDLPRNGTTVIGCAPLERTSLNYTSGKCALEDTDDVVVHYRYYPDRTYKYVTELDPDREVCDHWNPCQIGYIYSLPSPDQAVPANELWHDYQEHPEEYEREEIVPPVPEDSKNEYVTPGINYTTSYREVTLPEGSKFIGIGKIPPEGETRIRLTKIDQNVLPNMTNFHASIKQNLRGTNTIGFQLSFTPFHESDAGEYYAAYSIKARRSHDTTKFEDKIVILHKSSSKINPLKLEVVPGQKMNVTRIPLSCKRCSMKSMLLRGDDGTVANVDVAKYKYKTYGDKGQRYVEFNMEELRPEDFGDFYLVLQTEDGSDEESKVMTLSCPEDSSGVVKVNSVSASLQPGQHYDETVTFECAKCTVEDIICNGESVLTSGRVTVTPPSSININFPSFQDENACVYMGIFQADGKKYKNVIASIENASPAIQIPDVATEKGPAPGATYRKEIPYNCEGDCSVESIGVNGISIPKGQPNSRRFGFGLSISLAFFTVEANFIVLVIPNFSFLYEGVYQAVTLTSVGRVTKTILTIQGSDKGGSGSDAASTAGSDTTTAGLDVSTLESTNDDNNKNDTTTVGGDANTDLPASEAPGDDGNSRASIAPGSDGQPLDHSTTVSADGAAASSASTASEDDQSSTSATPVPP